MSQTIEPQVQWSQSEMIEISLNEPDDFLKVRDPHTYWCALQGKETLPIIYIFSIAGKYYIVHFKELFYSMCNM